jgi:adhesin/invasin
MRSASSIPVLVASLFAVWSCGGGDSTSPGGTNGGTPPVFSVVLDSGIVDSVAAPAGTAIPVRVRVAQSGTASAGATVTWTVQAGHGTVSSPTSLTDINGIASVSWTLGDSIGLNTLAAVSGDGSISMHAVGTAGIANGVTRVSPDSVSVVAGGTVSIIARAIDVRGNPVSGATLTFAASAGSLSVTTTTTSSSGNGETAFTTPTTPGAYTVTATLPGQASVIFHVNVI